MLSSQALNVGRSLGQGLGILSSSCALMQSSQFFSLINIVWKPKIGEKLQADQELDNEVNKFAMKVVKNNKIVGHLPNKYSQILRYFKARGRKICVEVTGRRCHYKQLCGGMGIPCRLVFSCSSKVKIDRLKELLESKIRR